MNRPSTAGLLVLLAFAAPVFIEAHTVLAYLGIDIPVNVYYPASVALVLLIVGVLMLLPKNGADSGKATEA